MSKHSISIVAIPYVEIIWDKVLPHIERVLEAAHGEFSVESIKRGLISGKSLLVTISDGDDIVAINIFEVRVLENGLRALYIPITGGHELFKWKDDVFELAKKIAKMFNCTEIRGISVREGWMDVLEPMGWETVHQIIKYNVEQ